MTAYQVMPGLTAEEAEALIHQHDSWLYIMQAGEAIKVGFSTNPVRRMGEIYSDLASSDPASVQKAADAIGGWAGQMMLQAASRRRRLGAGRDRLALLKIAPGDRRHERALLDSIPRHHRMTGEYASVAALDALLQQADWVHVGLEYRHFVPKAAWA